MIINSENYTVEFKLKNYEGVIQGGESILLSLLLEYLDLGRIQIKDVKEVKFSNEEYLKVEKFENDWKITSLTPFETEENLQIITDNEIINIPTYDSTTTATYNGVTIKYSLNNPVDSNTSYFYNWAQDSSSRRTASYVAYPSNEANGNTSTRILTSGNKLYYMGDNGKYPTSNWQLCFRDNRTSYASSPNSDIWLHSKDCVRAIKLNYRSGTNKDSNITVTNSLGYLYYQPNHYQLQSENNTASNIAYWYKSTCEKTQGVDNHTIVPPTRTSYKFLGFFDGTADTATQYCKANGSFNIGSSVNLWNHKIPADSCVAATDTGITLYAHWENRANWCYFAADDWQGHVATAKGWTASDGSVVSKVCVDGSGHYYAALSTADENSNSNATSLFYRIKPGYNMNLNLPNTTTLFNPPPGYHKAAATEQYRIYSSYDDNGGASGWLTGGSSTVAANTVTSDITKATRFNADTLNLDAVWARRLWFVPAWEPNVYNISYILNGGTLQLNTTTADKCALNPTSQAFEGEGNENGNGKFFRVGIPTRPGYIFLGWKVTGIKPTAGFTKWSGSSSSIAQEEITSGTLDTGIPAYVTPSTHMYFKSLTATNGGTVTFTALWQEINYDHYVRVRKDNQWKWAVPYIYTLTGWQKADPYVYNNNKWNICEGGAGQGPGGSVIPLALTKYSETIYVGQTINLSNYISTSTGTVTYTLLNNTLPTASTLVGSTFTAASLDPNDDDDQIVSVIISDENGSEVFDIIIQKYTPTITIADGGATSATAKAIPYYIDKTLTATVTAGGGTVGAVSWSMDDPNSVATLTSNKLKFTLYISTAVVSTTATVASTATVKSGTKTVYWKENGVGYTGFIKIGTSEDNLVSNYRYWNGSSWGPTTTHYNSCEIVKDTYRVVVTDNYPTTTGNDWWVVNASGYLQYTGQPFFEVVMQNSSGFFYCKYGKVDFSYTGPAQNQSGWWYCNAGKVDFTYNGTATLTYNLMSSTTTHNSTLYFKNGQGYINSGKTTAAPWCGYPVGSRVTLSKISGSADGSNGLQTPSNPFYIVDSYYFDQWTKYPIHVGPGGGYTSLAYITGNA